MCGPPGGAGTGRKVAAGDAVGLRVLLRFVVVLGAVNLAYYADKKLELAMVDGPYTRLVTWSSAAVGRLVLPYPVDSTGFVILADNRNSVYIASGCNGLEAVFLMFAAIVAYPASWRRRLRGLALYVPLLFLLNLIRVVSLVHVAHSHRAVLDLAHFQIAQGILIVFVLVFWVHYVRGLER
jgi:exosortase/archaeosortase family protein